MRDNAKMDKSDFNKYLYGFFIFIAVISGVMPVLFIMYIEHWETIVSAYIILMIIAIAIFCCISFSYNNRKKLEDINHTNHEKNYKIIKSLNSLTGKEFENFCSNLLRDNGFDNIQLTKGSGDHGIDITAYKDGEKYAIQCKRYSGSVGNKAVQEVYAGKDIYNADVAVVMTNSNFTKQAIQDAKKLHVQLWNGDKINSMIGPIDFDDYGKDFDGYDDYDYKFEDDCDDEKW